jgi:hypothetical protein
MSIAEFTTEYQGTLSSGQTTTATRLLQVVSDYIRLRKPDVDELAAEQVVFEVVRDSVTYGHYERLSSFESETSKRRERGTFDYAVKVLDELLTDKHKLMLGIATGRTVAPRGKFTKCDY